MTKIKGLLRFIALFVAYWMDHIKWGSRNKTKWVYGAYKSFRDNPKYLFYWAVENHNEIRSIWIARNRSDVKYLRTSGYECYYWLSLKGMYHTLTAGVLICDHSILDVNAFLSGGVFYVNLWHGCGVKRVRWQAKDQFVRDFHLRNQEEMRTSFVFKVYNYSELFRTPDLCLAPSKVQATEFFAPMMDIPLDKCVVGTFPRNRLLIEGRDSALQFLEKYEPKESRSFVDYLEKYKKVYIYMPTWRNDSSDFISESGILWDELNQVLCERRELLILKLHPMTKIDLSIASGYSNICLYPKYSDIYTILPFTDCLITDYSSIYSEFLIMNKEIILFVFDYEQYMANSYELSEYKKYYPGRRAYNFSQLLQIIQSGEKCKIPEDRRKLLMEFYWDDNKNIVDLVEEIKRRIA